MNRFNRDGVPPDPGIRALGVNDYIFPAGHAIKITNPSGERVLARFEANSAGGVDYKIMGTLEAGNGLAQGATRTGAECTFGGNFLGKPFTITVRNRGGCLALSIETKDFVRITHEIPAPSADNEIRRTLRGFGDQMVAAFNMAYPSEAAVYTFPTKTHN